MLEQVIDRGRYSFEKNELNKQFWSNHNLDSVHSNKDNDTKGIYVCSCTPNRNLGRISGDEFPEPCSHIQHLKNDGYLQYLITELYQNTPKEEKSKFIYLWTEILERYELKVLTDLVKQDISKTSS